MAAFFCSVDGNITMLLDRQVDAIRDLVDIVKRCYPGTKLFCWHTAPSVGTDNRNPHWFDKRPHVVAALNAAGRFVAKEKGLCLLDWERMFQVREGRALSFLATSPGDWKSGVQRFAQTFLACRAGTTTRSGSLTACILRAMSAGSSSTWPSM